MNRKIRDEEIHNIFEQIKAPDTSVERLHQAMADGNKKQQRFHRGAYRTVIASCCLLLILFAVSTTSASKAVIHKYANQLMDYFYGSNQKNVAEDSSTKKTVENDTDSNIRTEQIGEFQLTIYDTISYYSKESKTRLGCMYFSVEFTDTDSQNILAIWDVSTNKQRFFDKYSEIAKKAVNSEKYDTWIDMEVDNGDYNSIQRLYYYDEQKSSSGKYYFAVRWYAKDSQDKALGDTLGSDMVKLTLTDYAIEFDEENNLDYGELLNNHHYSSDGIVFYYHANTKEKSFKLSGGYTLHVNPIGIWLTKQKKQSEAEAWKEADSEDCIKIENKWIRQVEKKRSDTTIKYNGQSYSLTELAPIAFDGIYLNAIGTSGHGRWISAASFFENPIDINQIEVVN